MLAFVYRLEKIKGIMKQRRKEKKAKVKEMFKKLAESEEYKNDYLSDKANNAKSNQNAIPVIKEYKSIIERQKRNIIHAI